MLSAACEYSVHPAENRQSYSEDCARLAFWGEVKVERCFKVLPTGLSHGNGGLLWESSGLLKNKRQLKDTGLQELIQTLALIPRKNFGHFPLGCLYTVNYMLTHFSH